jgi:succinate dehydrogenase / fumarate reductase cytochrome b subunit
MSDAALSRKVSFWSGLRYRGKAGMANWILHRITGLGILLFVGLHVVASFFGQQFGSDAAFTVNTVYESWAFQIFVYFCVLFHALNGTRVALMDLFPRFIRYQRELIWLQWAIFVPLYLLPVYFLLSGGLFAG